MNLRRSAVLGALLLALAACGPADVQDAANTAASALPSLPPGAEATAAAALNDPAVQATAEAALNDPDVQAAASAAADLIAGLAPSDLRLQSDQPLVLDTTQQIAGVTNYRWVIAETPAGAESVKGQVISENSDGKLTIEPSDYAKYFPASGDYTINLELTFSDGSKQTAPIPLTAP
jgi:hypothetical protein